MSKSNALILSTNPQALLGYAADCKAHSKQCFLYSDSRPVKEQLFETIWKDDTEIHLLLVASGSSYKTWLDQHDSPHTLKLCRSISSRQQSTQTQLLRIVVCPTMNAERQKWQSASCREDLFNVLGKASLTSLALNGADDIVV